MTTKAAQRAEEKKRELKEKFLEYYRELPVQKLAAAYIGRDEDTIIVWKHEDRDFSDQMENARAEWARRKSKRVKSEEWLLERVMKDHFAPPKNETDIRIKELPKPLLSELDVPHNDRPQEIKELTEKN